MDLNTFVGFHRMDGVIDVHRSANTQNFHVQRLQSLMQVATHMLNEENVTALHQFRCHTVVVSTVILVMMAAAAAASTATAAASASVTVMFVAGSLMPVIMAAAATVPVVMAALMPMIMAAAATVPMVMAALMPSMAVGIAGFCVRLPVKMKFLLHRSV